MANKQSYAIELKEMSSYPLLGDHDPYEDQKESPASLPQIPPAAPVQNSRPATLQTPVVPVSSNPQGLSFLEEQRLKQQQSLNNPNLPSPPPLPNALPRQQSLQFPPQGQQMLSIQCSGCRGTINFPSNISLVFCTQCRATTATKPLLNIVCIHCRTSAYYAADNSHVRCRCGTVYSIRSA